MIEAPPKAPELPEDNETPDKDPPRRFKVVVTFEDHPDPGDLGNGRVQQETQIFDAVTGVLIEDPHELTDTAAMTALVVCMKAIRAHVQAVEAKNKKGKIIHSAVFDGLVARGKSKKKRRG